MQAAAHRATPAMVLEGGTSMNHGIDLVALARELATIASSTTDPTTALLLTRLVERLLALAGLPPGSG